MPPPLKKKRTSLSRLERKFCERVALLQSPHPTQAIRDCGYSGPRPDVKAWQLMALPRVKEHIARLEDEALQEAKVTRLGIVRELANIAFGDIRKLYNERGGLRPMHELDADVAAQIAGVEVDELYEGHGEDREQIGHVRKVKRFDKVKSLELLGKFRRLWDNTVEQAAPIGPGLTVIVQQGGQVNVQQNTQQLGERVTVNLPKPA